MIRAHRDERGSAALETTLMLTVLVPVLFAVLQFGDLYHRWLAQDAVTIHAARLAAERGGDGPEVRALVHDGLRSAGIDPAATEVRVVPARVGWREPIEVSLSSATRVAIPFVFTLTVPLSSSATARGELHR